MKKLLILVLSCLFLALLWGCGSPAEATPTAAPTEVPAPTAAPTAQPTATPAPEPTAAPTAEPTAEPTVEPTAEPAVEPTPAPAPTVTPAPEPTGDPGPSPEELKAIAERYIDSPVEDLYAAIGYPLSSDYAPSCLGDGEDGNLYYEGFTVYTYREGDGETVSYVE